MINTGKIFLGVVVFVLIVAILVTGILIRHFRGETFVPRRDMTTSDNTTFYSTAEIPSMPTPRFGNIDLNGALHYPVNNWTNGVSAIPALENYTATPACDNCQTTSSEDTDVNVVVDRLVFANRNSQLRSMGDPIRGDVPIVPSPPGWFRPSVAPQIDLQRGAMNILAGTNDATTQMDALLSASVNGLLPQSNIPMSTVSNAAYAQLGNRGKDLTIFSSM